MTHWDDVWFLRGGKAAPWSPGCGVGRTNPRRSRLGGFGCSGLSYLGLVFILGLLFCASNGAELPGAPQPGDGAVGEQMGEGPAPGAGAEAATVEAEGDVLLTQKKFSTVPAGRPLIPPELPPLAIVVSIALGIAFFAVGGVLGRSWGADEVARKKELAEKCAAQEELIKQLEAEYAEVRQQIAEEEERENRLRQDLEQYSGQDALLEAKQKEIQRLREAVEHSEKIEEEVAELRKQLSELNEELEKRAQSAESKEFLQEFRFLQQKIEEARSRALVSPDIPDESEITRLREELKAKEAEQAELEAALKERLPLQKKRDDLIREIQETQERVDELEKQAAELSAEAKGQDPRSIQDIVEYWDLVEESRILQERENYRAVLRGMREVRLLVDAVNAYVEKGEPGLESFQEHFAFMDKIDQIIAEDEPSTAEVTAALAEALPPPPPEMQKEQRSLDKRLAALTCVVVPGAEARTLRETEHERDVLKNTLKEIDAAREAQQPTTPEPVSRLIFKATGDFLEKVGVVESGKVTLKVEGIPGLSSLELSTQPVARALWGAMYKCELPPEAAKALGVEKALVKIPSLMRRSQESAEETKENVSSFLERLESQRKSLEIFTNAGKTPVEAGEELGVLLPLAVGKLDIPEDDEGTKIGSVKIIHPGSVEIYPYAESHITNFWSKKLSMGLKAYVAHRLLLSVASLHQDGFCLPGISEESIFLGSGNTPVIGDTDLLRKEGDTCRPLSSVRLPPEEKKEVLENGWNVIANKKSDSWHLGLTLYWLLTGGERPFSDKYWEVMEKCAGSQCDPAELEEVYAELENSSPSFRIRQYHAPGPWANVVAMLLEPDAESRPVPEQIIELYQNQLRMQSLSHYPEEYELSQISLVDVKKAELEAEAREMAGREESG